MNVYHQYTPLRIAMPFGLGIIIGLKLWPDPEFTVILTLAAGLFVAVLTASRILSANYPFRWVPGLLSSLAIMLAGVAMVNLVDRKSSMQDTMLGSADERTLMVCRLLGNPVQKSRSCSTEAEIIAFQDSTGYWKQSGAGVMVYFQGDSACQALKYGDVILASGIFDTVAGPANPHTFNYRQYLRNRQIRWQLSVKDEYWQWTGMKEGNPVRLWSSMCRDWFLSTLKDFKVEGDALALAAALLLGTKDMLDREVKQEFSYAGAMHVLCVSGLHVGIMYVVAERLLFFMKKGRRGRKIQQILILGFIWSYAFITGLSPSVLRAGLMFSLLAAGRMMRRNSINFNVLAGAAFIQLLINPYELTQVGFQLSYLAVAGIFAFYQPLNRIIGTSGKVFGWVWSVMAVSVAAQLATSPLACHYFGIFPVYFLLTNLVVVPLAGVIIYLALGLAVAGAAGLGLAWLAFPLKWSLGLLQGSVNTIQSFPGSVIQPVIMEPFQVICLYGMIIGIFILLVNARRNGVFLLILSLMGLSYFSLEQKATRQSGSHLIIYCIPGHTAIDLAHGRQGLFLYDSLLMAFPDKIESRVMPNRLRMRARDLEALPVDTHQARAVYDGWFEPPFLYYRGMRMAILNRDIHLTGFKEKIGLDLLLITGNHPIKLENALQIFEPDQVVIDGSVPFYRTGPYLEFCISTGITCHSVRQDGALILRWK